MFIKRKPSPAALLKAFALAGGLMLAGAVGIKENSALDAGYALASETAVAGLGIWLVRRARHSRHSSRMSTLYPEYRLH